MLILMILSLLVFGTPFQAVGASQGSKHRPVLHLPAAADGSNINECCGPDPIPPNPPDPSKR